MAHNDTKVSLISPLLDPSPSLDGSKSLKKRYRRSRSVPRNFILPERNHDQVRHTESIFATNHPRFRRVVLFLAAYLGVGAICFSLAKDQMEGKKTNGVLDSLYFCIVTMTTVGYGDLIPNSVATKFFACAFVFTGMGLVGTVISNSADYLVEKQEMMLVKYMHIHKRNGASEVLKEIESEKVKYKFIVNLIVLVVLMVTGTIFLYKVENLDFVDAFYCVCSTITTLGYGDMSFSTQVGRIFAVFWILTSTTCMGLFFLYLAELVTERRQQLMVIWVLSQKVTNVDLEAADLDDDGVVSEAEFVLYKLKEMGKINEDDITLVRKEFEDLDVDQSGTLTTSDVALAQFSHANS